MTKSSYWYDARHAKDRESRVICSWDNVGAVYIPLDLNINNYHATPLIRMPSWQPLIMVVILETFWYLSLYMPTKCNKYLNINKKNNNHKLRNWNFSGCYLGTHCGLLLNTWWSTCTCMAVERMLTEAVLVYLQLNLWNTFFLFSM